MAKLDLITGGDNFITSNGLQYRVEGERTYPVESFDVILYHSNADHNQVDKTLDLTSERTYKGTLRRGTSLVNPVITIQHPTTWFWNYMYIPEFQRYYFITDVVSVNLFLWEIHTHVDVLMTYKSGISDLTTRVLRSDSEANWTIADSMVPSSSAARVGYYSAATRVGGWKYPNINEPLAGVFQPAWKNHLLVKISVGNVQSGPSAQTATPPPLGYVWATMNVGTFREFCLDCVLMGQFTGDFKLSDIILDVKYLPVSISLQNTFKPYRMIFANLPYLYEDNYIDTYVFSNDFQISLTSFRQRQSVMWGFSVPVQDVLYRNNPPYKNMAIQFEPFGQIPINSQIWGSRSSFFITVDCDALTGDAILYIHDDVYREKLAEANIAIPIDVTAIEPQQRAQTQGLISGLGSIAGGILGSAITLNPVPMITGAMSGVGKMITGTTQPPTINSVGGSGTANAMASDSPMLAVSRLEQDNPNVGRIVIVDGREKVIAGTQGWLLNKDRKLSTLWGYTVVAGGVHVEGAGFRNCTTQERDELERLLTSGVILPKQI